MRNFLKKIIISLILVFLLSVFVLVSVGSPKTGLMLSPEDALAFINKVPRADTGFFDPMGFTLQPDLFPDRFKAVGILLENNTLIGVRTSDNFYYAVQMLQFDFASYEKFIIPFEDNFASSGMYVIAEDSPYFYEYMNVVIIDPETLNYCNYHSISIKMPNPDGVLNSTSYSDITKAIYFFKYIS